MDTVDDRTPALDAPGKGGVARDETVDDVDACTLPGIVCGWPGTYPPRLSRPPRRRSNEMPPLGCAAGDGDAVCSLFALPPLSVLRCAAS